MPPIDPNIIAGLRTATPVQLPDPFEQYGKSLTLKNLMRQGDAADRLEKRQSTLQSLLATNPDEEGLRRAGFLDESLKVGKEGRERAKLDAETRKTTAEAGKTDFETQIKKLEHGASLLSTVTDQASWDNALRVGQITGTFGQEAISKFPKEYNPQVVEAIKNAGMTRAQQLTAQNATAVQAETGRHNIATEENSAGTLKATQDRLAFDQAQPKGTYDSERGLVVDPRTAEARPVTMGGQPVAGKLSEAQKKELSSLDSQKSQVAGALKSVSENPEAFGAVRGAATMAGAIPESIAGRFDTDAQRQSRSYVFNVVSKVINERAGAAQSAQELARLRSFLPAETDNSDQIKSKLEAFQTYLDDSRAGYDKPQTASPPKPATTGATAAPKLGERQGGYVFKGGDPSNPKSWEKL